MTNATDAPEPTLVLTGERTAPGIAEENYWFRRHEVAYAHVARMCAGRRVLEAGSGEGYGADMLAAAGADVVCVDYDETAVAHSRALYPRLTVHQANLVDLPLPDDDVDVVVNFQVIEHLWDQQQFVAECRRVLRPGGVLLMSTPKPTDLLPWSRHPPSTRSTPASCPPPSSPTCSRRAGSPSAPCWGCTTGRRCGRSTSGGTARSSTRRSIGRSPASRGRPRSPPTSASIRTDDFEIHPDDPANTRGIDTSLDLLAVATA